MTDLGNGQGRGTPPTACASTPKHCRTRGSSPSYYSDAHENPGGVAGGKELTVAFEAAGRSFTTLNGGPHFKPNPSVSFFVEVASADEVNRIAELLLAGGQAMMPVGGNALAARRGVARSRADAHYRPTRRELD